MDPLSLRAPIPKALGYQCPVCDLIFPSRSYFRNHLSNYHSDYERSSRSNNPGEMRLKRMCPGCFQSFETLHERNVHMRVSRHFANLKHHCWYCDQRFRKKEHLNNHLAQHLGEYRVSDAAYGGRFQVVARTYEFYEVTSVAELRRFSEAKTHNIIDAFLTRFNAANVYITVRARFAKLTHDDEIEEIFSMPLTTSTERFFYGMRRQQIPSGLKKFYLDLDHRIDTVETRGSGFVLQDIVATGLHLAAMTFAGGSRSETEDRKERKRKKDPKASSKASRKKKKKGNVETMIKPRRNGSKKKKRVRSKKSRLYDLTEREKEFCYDVDGPKKNFCLYTSTAQAFLEPEPDGRRGGLFEKGSARYLLTANFIRQSMKTLPQTGGPIGLSEIAKFERLNRKTLDFAINVYAKAPASEMGELGGNEKRRKKKRTIVFPLYISSRAREAKKRINLMLCGDLQRDSVLHFVYVTDLAMFMGIRGGNTEICFYCLNSVRKSSYENHLEACAVHGGQRILMPKCGEDGKPPTLDFVPAKKRFYSPMLCFVDFEAANKYEEDEASEMGDEGGTEEDLEDMEKGRSITKSLKKQVPASYCILITSGDSTVLERRVYSSDTDLLEHFVDDLHGCYLKLRHLWNDCPEVPSLTQKERDEYTAAVHCWICGGAFVSGRSGDEGENGGQGLDKVIDHSHSSLQGGKYIGAAHRKCNSSRVHCSAFPTFCHNLDKYDGAFVALASMMFARKYEWKISGIPQNRERFLAWNLGPFHFKDSLHFIPASLSQIVEQVKEDGYDFPLLRKMKWRNLDGGRDEDFELMTRKGVFPYKYVRSVEQMKICTRLPDKAEFFSELSQENISDEDYEFAKHFWTVSGCKNLLDYCHIYVVLDTVLLASIVNVRRAEVYSEYSLDMAQFVSAPHLNYNVLLSTVETKVELLTDAEMFTMLERGIRGGMAMASTRHDGLPPDYSESESEKCLLLLDAVNLYGDALSRRLPCADFEWLTQEEIDSTDWAAQKEDQDTGYIVECDLEYPEELHESHESYPLAPENFNVSEDMLSEYQKLYLQKFGLCGGQWKGDGKFVSCGKLGANYGPRKNYVVHYLNLALYLELGLKLVNVKRAFRFTQKSWIAEYVAKKTRQRAEATSKFTQQQKKDEVNTVYGKLMQNLRKMLQVKFAMSYEEANRCLTRFFCDHWRVMSEDATVFFTRKRSFTQDRPLYVGFATLELSKYRMFDLFYRHIRKEFPKSRVVLTDTDSLLLSVEGTTKSNFYEKMAYVMDLSNLPKDHEHHSEDNKKRPGYLKDELAGVQLGEVVALKAKCYSYISLDKKLRSVKCKGIKKSAAKKHLTFDAYKGCLTSLKELRLGTCRLQSKSYEMHLMYTRKIALSSLDLKRYLMACGIHSLPYWDKRILDGSAVQKCCVCSYSVSDMSEMFGGA